MNSANHTDKMLNYFTHRHFSAVLYSQQWMKGRMQKWLSSLIQAIGNSILNNHRGDGRTIVGIVVWIQTLRKSLGKGMINF